MKKLYIGFILLFGFLAFVPQIVLGDLLIEKEPSEISIENRVNTNTYNNNTKEGTTKYLEEIDYPDIYSQDQLDYDGIPDFVIRGMLIALLLTLVIEGLLAAPFGWKFVGLVSLANIITNPALNGIIWHYQITSTQTILLLEAAVVLIEWGIFSVFIRKNYGKLLLFAFIANLVSYLTGVFFPL